MRPAPLAAPTLSLLLCCAAAPGCATLDKPQVLYIARHGQTEYNRVARYQGDPDLDAVGYLNRVSLWHLTRGVPLDAVYASARQRTRRTAALVAEQHGLAVRVRAELNEIDAGIGEGICVSQMAPQQAAPEHAECEVPARGSRTGPALAVIQRAYREAAADRVAGHLPLGESLRDVVRKTGRFLVELRRELRGPSPQVLVVGHGVINRALLHHLMGWPVRDVAWLKQANDQVFRLEAPTSGRPRLYLYTPGLGWRRCRAAPRPEQKYLDCNPDGDRGRGPGAGGAR